MVYWNKYWSKGNKIRLNLNTIRSSRFFIIQVLKGAIFLSIGMGIYSLCYFIFNYILIHIWNPKDYGVFMLILTIVGLLVTFTAFNLNATIAIFLAKDIKNPTNRKTLIEILLVFALLTFFVFTITFGITRFSISEYPILDILQRYFWTIWILVIATGLTSVGRGVLRAYKKMNYEAISNIAKGLSTLGLISFAIYIFSKISVASSVSILIIAQILALLVVIKLISRKNLISISGRNLIREFLGGALKKIRLSNIGFILTFSLFMTALSISTIILFSIDRIMIPQFLSMAMLGFYGGANLISRIPKIVTATVASSLIPFVSERSGDRIETKRQYLNFLSLFVFLYLIGYGLFIYFAPFLIKLLLTKEYSWVVSTSRILLIGMLFSDIYHLNATFTASIGAIRVLKRMILVLAIAVVANIVLNLTFIPMLGIEGAAIASSISFAFTGIVSTVQVVRIRVQ